MDWKSFIAFQKLTDWEPTSISSNGLDYDTIKMRQDTIVGMVNSYCYVYYNSTQLDTEWLVVNFRNINNVELLKKYTFTKERISYNNMYILLEMNPEKDFEKHNKTTGK